MGLRVGGYIVVDGEVCHGKPVFNGTRILVSDVLELLATGVPGEEIVRDYYPDLSEEAVGAALKWAAAKGASLVPGWRLGLSTFGLLYRRSLFKLLSALPPWTPAWSFSRPRSAATRRRLESFW